MNYLSGALVFLAMVILTGCDFTDFEATWQAPDVRPIDLRTEHIATLLLSGNESVRRSFEYNLARQLSRHGIEATPGYELLSEADVTNKEDILSDLQTTTATHAVFMRIIDREKELNYVPGSGWYPGSYYDRFFWYEGAFFGPWGFGGAWPPYYDSGYYRVDEVVSVETLVFSVPEKKLVWTGLSKTMNPDEIDDFVKELVSGAVKEMRKTGFLPGKVT